MAPQWNMVPVRPCEHAVDDGIVDFIAFTFHTEPLHGIFGNSGIKVLQEFFMVLSPVGSRHRSVHKAIADGTAEPELVSELFDGDSGTRSRVHDQFAFAVLRDVFFDILTSSG